MFSLRCTDSRFAGRVCLGFLFVNGGWCISFGKAIKNEL